MIFNPYHGACSEPCPVCGRRVSACRLPVLIPAAYTRQQILMGKSCLYEHIRRAHIDTQIVGASRFLETTSLIALHTKMSTAGVSEPDVSPTKAADSALSAFCLPSEIRLSESVSKLGLSTFLINRLAERGEITVTSRGRSRLIQIASFADFLNRNRGIGAGRLILNRHLQNTTDAVRG